MTRAAFMATLLLVPSMASAGAWTRDAGHGYANVSYGEISATRFYSPDFRVVPIQPYAQHVVNVYGEVGILSRWLTATVDGTLFRYNRITDAGATLGVGDWRLGLWTGLVTKPVRLSFGVTVGIPTGDPTPHAPAGADADAQEIARSLPTGDGEWDVEGRFALGYSFGGKRRWPLVHYLVVEAGYWLRTAGFSDDFVYKVELGTGLPWRIVDRFQLILRLAGIESFASNQKAAQNATGLGDGVTYTSPGIELYGRIVRRLGASVAVEGALRARSLPAAAQVRATISYTW